MPSVSAIVEYMDAIDALERYEAGEMDETELVSIYPTLIDTGNAHRALEYIGRTA